MAEFTAGPYSPGVRIAFRILLVLAVIAAVLAAAGYLHLRRSLPQTEGELRGRASRMVSFDDLDALRGTLEPLSSRGLIVYLGEPGRRGTMLTHGFHPAVELEHLRGRHASGVEAEPGDAPRRVDARGGETEAELADLRQEVAALRDQVAALSNTVEQLTAQLHEVRQGLGL